jgi:hypothetical protein
MIFEFYPTIGGGIYFWRNEAALKTPLEEIPSLGGRWSLKFVNIIDYNSDPAPGFKKRVFSGSKLYNSRFDLDKAQRKPVSQPFINPYFLSKN